MAININRNVEDAFYRYKMPRLLAKVEGKGNGIKTVVANMVDIAKALNRPPTYPTKYFGCELGAQTQFDLKNDRYIVNGDHDAVKLQDLLDGFIKKFVLCQECDNPETTLTVKGQKITLSCKACGHVTAVDPRHRLTTFVIKNPPPPPSDLPSADAAVVAAVTAPVGKRSSKGARSATKSSASVENGHHGSSDGNEQNSPTADDEALDEDDGDWAVDPDDAEDRQRELVGNMANITMNDDLEKSVDERLKIFEDYLKAKMKKNQDLDPKLVQAEADRLDVKEEALLVICRVIFDEKPSQLVDEKVVQNFRQLFLRFSAGNERAQRHLLGALEQILTSSSGRPLVAKIPRILELFYDNDILEEKQILRWGDKTSSKYVTRELNKEVRAKAQPFLKWLKEAEEESGNENDEEDDGVEIIYDNKPIQNGKSTVASTPASVAQANYDDLDIDNI
uniref:Eukaryotic translation initiation factor 5 n=1 Tax=Romanomermis culicivorax TaxID=13658 RepID=A0A915I2B6_ROMCU